MRRFFLWIRIGKGFLAGAKVVHRLINYFCVMDLVNILEKTLYMRNKKE